MMKPLVFLEEVGTDEMQQRIMEGAQKTADNYINCSKFFPSITFNKIALIQRGQNKLVSIA